MGGGGGGGMKLSEDRRGMKLNDCDTDKMKENAVSSAVKLQCEESGVLVPES